MKKKLILLLLIFYCNYLKPFKITFPLPGIVTNTCRIEGTAEPFEVIKIFIKDQIIERLVADKNGKWSCCPKFPLDKTNYEYKNIITVCNSKNQSIQQEISIKIKPVQLKFINNTLKPITAWFISEDNTFAYNYSFTPGNDVTYIIYHIECFYIEDMFKFNFNSCLKNIKKITFNYSSNFKPEVAFTISELLKPYLEYKKFIFDYHENKKNKLIEYLNHAIPLDLINIINDYAYSEEKDFDLKIETIKYHILDDGESKIKLINENEYNLPKK